MLGIMIEQDMLAFYMCRGMMLRPCAATFAGPAHGTPVIIVRVNGEEKRERVVFTFGCGLYAGCLRPGS